MTVGQLIDRALRIKGNRVASVEDTDRAGLIEEANRSLQLFTVSLRTLWSSGESFTYPAGGSPLALPDLSPVDISIPESGGSPRVLRDLDDGHGPVSEFQITERAPWLLTSAGSPVVWTNVPPDGIRLYPEPGAELTIVVSGWRRHRAVSAESDGLEIAARDEEMAARYLVSRLLIDSEDEGARGFGREKEAEVVAYGRERADEVMAMMGARRIRGKRALDRVIRSLV